MWWFSSWSRTFSRCFLPSLTYITSVFVSTVSVWVRVDSSETKTLIIYAALLSGLSLAPRAHNPLTPLSSSPALYKQIFVAAATAASEAAACSRAGKFYQTLNSSCERATGRRRTTLVPSKKTKTKKPKTGLVKLLGVFSRPGCHGEAPEMFVWGGCFCGLRVIWEWVFPLCGGVRGPLGAASVGLLKSVILRVMSQPRGGGAYTCNLISPTIISTFCAKRCKSFF